jgi:aldehyde dehydrogenase (NAD+)
MQGVKPGPLERDGFYLEPTLVEVEDPTNPFTQEEILAPVAALLKAGSAQEAMQIANGVRQGLVAVVYANDLNRAMEFANRLEAGLVRVNSATVSVDCHVPLGGSKVSGLGHKEHSLAARYFYTETKAIFISHQCSRHALDLWTGTEESEAGKQACSRGGVAERVR